jgi:5-methylcytosine-specific restriction endonuclease McrA
VADVALRAGSGFFEVVPSVPPVALCRLGCGRPVHRDGTGRLLLAGVCWWCAADGRCRPLCRVCGIRQAERAYSSGRLWRTRCWSCRKGALSALNRRSGGGAGGSLGRSGSLGAPLCVACRRPTTAVAGGQRWHVTCVRCREDRVLRALRERDGARCRGCGTAATLTVHHINGRVAGRVSRLRGLVILCRSCHLAAHNWAFGGAAARGGDWPVLLRAVLAAHDYGLELLVPEARMLLSRPAGRQKIF